MLALLSVSMSTAAFNVQSAKANASLRGKTVQATGTDWWPTFHHDLNRTGASTTTAPTTNNTLWNYATGGVVYSSPAVVSGLVYVGSGDFNVYCLNATAGAFVWSYKTGGWVYSSPTIVGGFVYVGSDDYNVYCLNAATGAFVWSYKTGDVVSSSPAVVNGVVYIGSYDGKIYAFGTDWWSMFHHDLSHTGTSTSKVPTTNNTLWTYLTGGGEYSSPAVVDGLFYVGSSDDYVYCLNANTGAFVWSYKTGDQVHSCPAVAGGLVYVGSNDYSVYCLNAATGAFVWSYKTGSVVYSSPAVAGGLVYVGSYDDYVYCLNANTGALIWSHKTSGMVFSSPAVVGGFVYVGSDDWSVYCLNANTGALIWSYTTGSMVDSSPAVVGGLVFVGSDDYHVYCLNANTGSLVWSYTTFGQVYSSPALVNGVVYVGGPMIYAFGLPTVRSTEGVVGITGYKLVFKETINNTLGSPATINYYWSFSLDEWNGTQWVATALSGSSTSVTGYVIPAQTTVDLPYYVYLLPMSGSNAVAWGNWLLISFTFYWTYSGVGHSADYTAKLNVHPGDIAGAASIAFPYLGADGVVGAKDLHVLGLEWGLSTVGADPTSNLARADINGDGVVGAKDLHILGLEWSQTWTNTPPPS